MALPRLVAALAVMLALTAGAAARGRTAQDISGLGDLETLLRAWKGGKVDINLGQVAGQEPPQQQPHTIVPPPQQPVVQPVQPVLPRQPEAPAQQAPVVDDSPIVPRSTSGTLTCSSKIGYTPPPQGKPAAPLTLKGGEFMADGKVVNLHGVNWFGFNAHATYLHGLWVGQASANSDFAAIIHQFKLLGFNAVRLPFIFGDLATPADPIGGYCTHESTLEELAQRTIDPDFRGPITKAAPVPNVPLPSVATAGSCNTYIPPAPGSPKLLALERYGWTVQWLIAQGFYVMVDYHPMGMEQTSFVVDDFVREWKKVWAYIGCLPNFERDIKGRLLVDICNEPDSQWQGWQPKNGKAGFTELYLGAMDAIEAMTPGWPIFVVEGAGQGAYAGLNWGNGFVTDPAIVKEYGITDANPFFQALLQRPYLDRMVISPHIYGPSVSSRKDWYKGKEWMLSLDKAVGYLNKDGYCAAGKCHVFPIVVGEFGSRFTNPEDLAHLEDLALYMRAEGAGDTGGHKPFLNFMYWAYNANSGDTGGLVDDSWMNWEWVKLRYLGRLGLKPWYK